MAFMEWVTRGLNAGVIRSGARLERRAMKLSRGSSVTTALGSAVPGASEMASYLVVEAENMDSAVAIAAGCPAADPGIITVFQLDLTAAVGDARADAASVR